MYDSSDQKTTIANVKLSVNLNGRVASIGGYVTAPFNWYSSLPIGNGY